MTPEELESLIAEVQHRQSELNNVEVKSARSGTPKRLYEAVSAFANRTGGGVILFGLDGNADFAVVGVKDAHRLQSDIGDLASSEMEPALRPEFTVEDIGGRTVVAVETAEVPVAQRPCYYKPAGLQKGAYIRVGNTNRQMTDYAIFGYVSARAQPAYDEETVAEATMDDLDQDRLDAYLDQLRRTRPKAAFLRGARKRALSHLWIVRDVAGTLRPTLAGLLTFGKYPQQFLPQLVITFLQFYVLGRRRPRDRRPRCSLSRGEHLRQRRAVGHQVFPGQFLPGVDHRLFADTQTHGGGCLAVERQPVLVAAATCPRLECSRSNGDPAGDEQRTVRAASFPMTGYSHTLLGRVLVSR
jgi:predicted HTH transcriptional regulator